MIEEKIGKLIDELDTAMIMLNIAATKDKTVDEAKQKIFLVSLELNILLCDIKTEKAIDGCRVRQMEMSDEGTGDCGIAENGQCLGYKDDDGMLEQCRVCEYSVICEEEE